MEINVNALKPAAASGLFSGGKRADIVRDVAPPAKNAEVDPIMHDQQVKDLSEVEKQRLDTVIKATQSPKFKNFFAVGDSTFTIYKDASGQFVTRITSLRDGRVSYIPEPDIAQFMESTSEMRAALLQVQA